MITAEVDVNAKAFLSNCSFYLSIRLKGNKKELYLSTKAVEEIARIVNQCAVKIRARPYGYEAEIPETVALAVQYVAYSQTPPPMEEIDEIVKTGTTRIHRFLTGIGFEEYANPNPLEGLPQKPLSRGDCEIGVTKFPTVTLYLKDEEENVLPQVVFDVNRINVAFVRGVIEKEASSEEVAMLKGITLLANKTQKKCMQLLSSGYLTLEELAKTLCRSAVKNKNEHVSRLIISWLEKNGFKNYASKLIIEKTLCR